MVSVLISLPVFLCSSSNANCADTTKIAALLCTTGNLAHISWIDYSYLVQQNLIAICSIQNVVVVCCIICILEIFYMMCSRFLREGCHLISNWYLQKWEHLNDNQQKKGSIRKIIIAPGMTLLYMVYNFI